ncbi:MAG: LysR family transcriptional regulator [Peptococcales bacterium]|jgi:DNA-binding transcriptional LysR family regulator
MNFNQIAYFVEIVNCGSISKAADKLFISQSALTLSLQSMEKELGFKLLNRTYSGSSCTPEGEIFYQDALQILNFQKK